MIEAGKGMLRVLARHALAGAFDANQVKLLIQAFDQAWKAVEESGGLLCFRPLQERDARSARLAYDRDRAVGRA
jgi:hypothetical protein